MSNIKRSYQSAIKKGLTGIAVTNHLDYDGMKAMLNHGVYTEADGDSVVLYDTAIPEGKDKPRNNPSIGFYDNDHNLLARIKYENGTLKTERAKWEDSEHVIKWVDLD